MVRDVNCNVHIKASRLIVTLMYLFDIKHLSTPYSGLGIGSSLPGLAESKM
jgi:hypothetical protein